MKDREFELNLSISIPILQVIGHMAIASIVLLCFSSINNFNNIKSIPLTAFGITTGFVIFELGLSFFKNRKKPTEK